jgi:hypothetical protein
MYSGTWLAEQTGVKAPVERVAVSEREPWWKEEWGERWNSSLLSKGGKKKRVHEVAVTHTRQSEENDLLVGELLGGVVVDGDTARGDLAGVLSPGDVTGKS